MIIKQARKIKIQTIWRQCRKIIASHRMGKLAVRPITVLVRTTLFLDSHGKDNTVLWGCNARHPWRAAPDQA